jgi:catechol 2,3-dioxygenase-like lactoylglutathione lyase family enzyme
MTSRLHHASITTPDIDRLSLFYCEQFGFERVMEVAWAGDNPMADLIYGLRATAVKMVMLKADNAFLELFEFAHPVGASGQPERPVCDVGITHICICVDDVEKEYGRLVAAGMTFNCPPQHVPGLCTATYGRDPDGNIVELMQVDPDGPFAL